MYSVWYWAVIDREIDGRFIASIPDLGNLTAYGHTDKDAVAHVTELAGERVRAVVDDGQQVPSRRHSSEMPSHIRRSKEVGSSTSLYWMDPDLSHLIAKFPCRDGSLLWRGGVRDKWRRHNCLTESIQQFARTLEILGFDQVDYLVRASASRGVGERTRLSIRSMAASKRL